MIIHAEHSPEIGTCSCASPKGCHRHGPQPREHAIRCQTCRMHMTLNIKGICDYCLREAARAE